MQDDRAAFIEGFALKLNESGMQRMAARVFATLLTAPGGGLTAREIAETLGASAGAVSGATSYLTRTGLVERTRTPGERVDRYDIKGTSWAEVMAVETEMLLSLSSWLDKGASAVAGDLEATDRLEATRDFFAFMADEMPKLVERWQTSHRQNGATGSSGSEN
jgi:DNA-binding transcriptional regulator GbsR (MarR family)